MTVVRRFRGHTDRITDLTVSSDCRWLLSASMDGTVRVWDIPDSRTFQVRCNTPAD
jgi:U3 small nucleolar RNA-associated protein 21